MLSVSSLCLLPPVYASHTSACTKLRNLPYAVEAPARLASRVPLQNSLHANCFVISGLTITQQHGTCWMLCPFCHSFIHSVKPALLKFAAGGEQSFWLEDSTLTSHAPRERTNYSLLTHDCSELACRTLLG